MNYDIIVSLPMVKEVGSPRAVIYSLLKDNNFLTRKDISDLTGISLSNVNICINELEQLGYIKPIFEAHRGYPKMVGAVICK